MQNFICNIILGKLFGWADGYKRYLAGLGWILTGIVGLIAHFYPDQAAPAGTTNYTVEVSLGFIMQGIGVIGKAHAEDKANEIQKAILEQQKTCAPTPS